MTRSTMGIRSGGVYASRAVSPLENSHVDIYYFGLDKKSSKYVQGIARDQRHTAGARFWGDSSGWDYDEEGIFQFGKFGSDNIRAWAVATNNGYTFKNARFRPRIALDAGAASGDSNLTLGTFNALFPKGAYFSEAELIGPYNVIVARPSVRFELRKNISITPDFEFLWRQSTQDGLYRVPEVLVRPGLNSNARYIGSQANLELECKMNRHFSATLIYLHFFPGDFLKQSQPSRPVNFVAPWLTYVF